jgi:plastocyanin
VRLVLALALLLVLVPFAPAQNATETNTSDEPADVQPDEGAATNESNATGEEAAPAGPITIELQGYQEGGSFFWRVKGNDAKNPTITVEPGQEVTFHVTSVSGLHNLAVGDQKVSPVINEGDSADYAWTAPAEAGSVVYICKIHGTSMSGRVQVGAATGGGGAVEGGAGGIQGESIDLADVGHPECAGYKIPAVVTRKVVGGPTVEDYARSCKAGASSAEVRQAHPADYVIPGSFALIGLGVVAMVWVHRKYKP